MRSKLKPCKWITTPTLFWRWNFSNYPLVSHSCYEQLYEPVCTLYIGFTRFTFLCRYAYLLNAPPQHCWRKTKAASEVLVCVLQERLLLSFSPTTVSSSKSSNPWGQLIYIIYHKKELCVYFNLEKISLHLWGCLYGLYSTW